MNLDFSTWKSFAVSKILTIMNGKGITKEEIAENEGSFEVVQSGENNNGVIGKIDLVYCKSMGYTYTEKPCLTVARSGSAGFVSFQINGCVVGDSAKILLLDDCLATTEHYVFLQSILMANKFKYTYGRKVTEEKYMNDLIDLPIQHNADGTPFIDVNKKYSDDGYVPDWKFMENYIKSLHHKPLTTTNKSENVPQLDVEKWKEFYIGKLFNINRGKTLSSENKEEFIGDDYSCINGGSVNNGELCKMSEELQEMGFVLQEVPSLSLSRVGNAGLTFLQTEPYYIADNAFSLVLKKQKNKFVYLFLSTCLNSEVFKYSYGRTISSEKYMLTAIKLPVQHNADGTIFIDDKYTYSEEGYVPDWQFMEDYIKSLPYGDRL